MPELTLDDVERYALTGELERMRVAQLVRRYDIGRRAASLPPLVKGAGRVGVTESRAAVGR